MRILVIRTSALGDVVLTSPALRALAARFPEASVELLTARPYAPLFSGLPFVHRVWSEEPGEKTSSLVSRLLADGPIDRVVDLQNKVKTYALLRRLAPSESLRLIKRRGLEVIASLAGKGEVWDDAPAAQAALDLLAAWGCAPVGLQPEVALDPSRRGEVDARLPAGAGPLVALAPAARWELKRWPVARFAALGAALADRGARLLLVGGPGDEGVLAELREALPDVPLCDTLGLDVPGLAAALARADLLVTNDSGPSHLAQAVGTPVVAVFGPTSVRRWGPVPGAGTALSLPVACAPCSNYGKDSCSQGDHYCMQGLEVGPVLEVAAAALAAGRSEGGVAAKEAARRLLVPLAMEVSRVPRGKGAASESPGSRHVVAPRPAPRAKGVERLYLPEEPISQRIMLAPLHPPSLLFAAAAASRRGLYAKGWLRRHRPPFPVISVGNLAAGGAGKTPVVIHLAQELLRRGQRVAVLSHGYGGTGKGPMIVSRGDGEVLLSAEEAGDEAVLVARRCPDAVVLAGRKRVELSQVAEELGATVAVVDDGFQHLAIERDLDVVVLDGSAPFGNGHLLPRGPLRERPAALARADLCWISKVDQGDATKVAELSARLRRLCGKEAVQSRYRVSGLLHADGSPASETLRGEDVFLLAAVARPGSFRRTLEQMGAQVVGELLLPDHRAVDASGIAEALRRMEAAGARFLVCTEKDAVKLPDAARREERLRVVAVETEIVAGAESLAAALAFLDEGEEALSA